MFRYNLDMQQEKNQKGKSKGEGLKWKFAGRGQNI